MSAEFTSAAEKIKTLKTEPSQAEMLQLYALFKQGTNNPTFENAPKPGFIDIKGKTKRAEWEKLVKEGVTPDQAQEKYIALVNELVEKYGTQ